MGFPYGFPLRFADAKTQRDEQLSTYGTVQLKSSDTSGYSTPQAKSSDTDGYSTMQEKTPLSTYQED